MKEDTPDPVVAIPPQPEPEDPTDWPDFPGYPGGKKDQC